MSKENQEDRYGYEETLVGLTLKHFKSYLVNDVL